MEIKLLVTGNSRFRNFTRSNSWPWWFLATGCFWAGIQSFAAWCKGARIGPLSFFDELGGSDLPILAWLVLIPLIVWPFIQASEGLFRNNWAINKPIIGKSAVLLFALAAFTTIYVEEELFSPGYWTRMGERHLISRIGGIANIARDSADLLEKVKLKNIQAINNNVSVEQLSAFPALSAWKFERCDVNVEMSRVIYVIDHQEGITVLCTDGKWRVQRARFSGLIYWSESQPQRSAY